MICNNLLTAKLLQMQKNAVPLHPVISFSVINYVVSMRRPRASGEVSFFLLVTQISITTKWLPDGSHQRVSYCAE